MLQQWHQASTLLVVSCIAHTLAAETTTSKLLPELAQAQEAVSGVRPEAAQARGRSLLNLKLRESEGGLLGRTLLTLILNKVSNAELRLRRAALHTDLDLAAQVQA